MRDGIEHGAAQRAELQRKLENLDYDCAKGLDEALARFRRDHVVTEGEEWRALSELGGYTFSEMFQFELDALAGEQSLRYREAAPADVNRRAHGEMLSGLALSGGGIRSATFNLGILQALAEMKLLRHFDYLSTVSGGGYIGGWLSKWIGECGGDVTRVEEQLAGDADEPLPRRQPWPVQFLRRYSNYLTPRTGLFSADTWTLICTYCRNTGLNMTMLCAWLAFIFLLPRLLLNAVPAEPAAPISPAWHWAAIGSFLWVVFHIALSISRRGKLPWQGIMSQSQTAVIVCICVPLMFAGFTGAVAAFAHRHTLAGFWNDLPASLMDSAYLWFAVPGLLYFAAWAAGWCLAQWLNARAARRANAKAQRDSTFAIGTQGGGHFASAVTALAIGSALLLKAAALCVALEQDGIASVNAVRLATFGMPAMLLLFGVTIMLMIGLVGRLYRDQSREWWARQGAWTSICAIGWLAVVGSAFYLPPLLDYAWSTAMEATTAAGVLTALATAIGLKTGSGKSTGGNGAPRGPAYKELVAQVAPYAFTLLTLALITTVLQWLVAPPHFTSGACRDLGACVALHESNSAAAARGLFAPAPPARDALPLVPLMAGLLATALILGWRVDVNKFSLYMMYRLRLVRAYLGASTPNRAPHPFTGFDPRDDRKLHDQFEQRDAAGKKTGRLQRPFHLINAAVNIVGGKELAWQTRKAGNFSFSPACCGFEFPQMPPDGGRSRSPRGAYRPTAEYGSRATFFKDDDAGVHLGMAVAVSGAAASPSMGYHSSPPLSFLMTLFNLRLGRWSPNPVRKHVWKRAAPRLGIASILSELFGMTDTTANFLYLSDGGHFENLGLYELVRRRCRLIVVVDASADGKFEFGDLGNAIRRCQTDFNVAIHLKGSDIRSLGGATPQAVSFVKGTIAYAQADGPGTEDGVLLYIKPIVAGDENADIVNYSKMHPEFPHQSTADQWFDEDQFESYRMLGVKSGRAALGTIAASLPPMHVQAGLDRPGRKAIVGHVCEALRM